MDVEGYSYLENNDASSSVAGHDSVKSFRVKEITTEEQAKEWINKLQLKSCVTWRVSKAEREGRLNVFKQYLHCQHARDIRVRGERSSKKTGCPATLQITVQRSLINSRSKVAGRCVEGWPTLVTLRSDHNHSTTSASVLKHRDLCEESHQRLVELYHQGHSPSSALHCMKTDLLVQYGDTSHQLASDGFYMPSLSVAYKLFNKEFNLNITDPEDIMQSLDELFKRIKQGTVSNPSKYIPAVHKMVKNAAKFAATEDGLVSAMLTFGKDANLKPASTDTNRTKLGVKLSVVGRRHKLAVSGKRRGVCGHPTNVLRDGTSVDHQVTTMRYLS